MPDTQVQQDSVANEQEIRSVAFALRRALSNRPTKNDIDEYVSTEDSYFEFDTVQDACEAINQFNKPDDFRKRIFSLSDSLFEMYLEKFFKQYRPEASGFHRSQVALIIKGYLRQQRWEQVELLLKDVASSGVRVAIESSEKIDSGSIFGHVMAGLFAGLEVLVVLLIFNACQSNFETLVMSSLALIYAGVTFGMRANARQQQFYFVHLGNAIDHLRMILKDDFLDMELFREQHDELARSLKKQSIRHYIFWSKLGVIEIIAVIQLFRVIS